MAIKDAASAYASNLDRMGALAKWIAAKAEELAQLDRKIDRRIDHLQRSEDNLRAMFEALREQVIAAHSVSEQLQKHTFAADEHERHADSALVAALEKASALAESVEAKRRELHETADTIVQTAADRVSQLMEKVQLARAQAEQREAALVQAAPLAIPAQQSRFDADVASVQADFDQRSATAVESIRRSAIEQIQRLASQAAVAVDPVLARVDAQRDRAEAQLDAAVGAAEDALRKRAQELARTGDAVVDNLEQRLARRLENVRPRTTEILDAAERSMNQRLTALLDGARISVSSTEEELAHRVAQLRPRLDATLQAVQDDLVEQLARLEEHAFSMTGWLEKRMSDRVDALIARVRSDLLHTPAVPVAPLSSEAISLACYSDEYPAPASPNSVDVQVFVDRRGDRNQRSSASAIFQ
jgi:hypothetical protein